MKKIEYARMAEREHKYWWHVGRLRIIEQYMTSAFNASSHSKTRARVLNVGCGTGGTLPVLEKFGAVKNVDVSNDAILFMNELGYSVDKVSGIKLPYKDKSFDYVGAFDVLEHIEHDTDALIEWFRVLRPGGKLVITVPAYRWLWSDHDVSLHHFRRYTKKAVREKSGSAGFNSIKISYAIVFSLPLVVGFRYINKILGRKTDSETSYVNLPDWMNALFTNILFVEAKAHKYISFPFGTSVIAILERKSE